MTSVLSQEPDGMGCYYGRAPDDPRLVNVWFEPARGAWRASVGNERVRLGDYCWSFPSKSAAEAAALAWIELHPLDEPEAAP